DLRQRDQARPDAQQAANIEMLASLRLDRFTRRDHQHHDVDSARARQHILDEALVPRYVHEPDTDIGRKVEMRESDVDGNAAALLPGKAIRVDTGESLYQSSFPVIDGPRGAYDDVLHPAASLSAPYSITAASNGSSASTKKWSFASTQCSSFGSPNFAYAP